MAIDDDLGDGKAQYRRLRRITWSAMQELERRKVLLAAGALVGIAGGGLVWFVELNATLVIRVLGRRRDAYIEVGA